MRVKYFLIAILIGIFFFPNIVTATSPYGKIDVYFNDNILPGDKTAKPILKINEPFNVKVNMTMYNEYKVSGKLTELEAGFFEVIAGPSKMNQYSSTIIKANESYLFEWTVIPTDKWAGGSIPINFHYSIVEKGNPEPVVNSEFTVAYCTISNERYDGEIPTSEEQPVTEAKPSPTSSSGPASSSASTPAFTLVGSVSVLSLAFSLLRR